MTDDEILALVEPVAEPHGRPELSAHQRRVILYFAFHVAKMGTPPAMTDVNVYLGTTSTQSVHDVFQQLVKKGYLVNNGGRRGYALVGVVWAPVRAP